MSTHLLKVLLKFLEWSRVTGTASNNGTDNNRLRVGWTGGWGLASHDGGNTWHSARWFENSGLQLGRRCLDHFIFLYHFEGGRRNVHLLAGVLISIPETRRTHDMQHAQTRTHSCMVGAQSGLDVRYVTELEF